MTGTSKSKLPLAITLAVMLLLAAAAGGVGYWLSRPEYGLVSDSSPEASRQEASADESAPSRHVITLKGDEPGEDFDAALYVKRLYELKYQMAVDGFSSVDELSPNVAVQYAFCHIYYDSLVDMPEEKAMLFRQVLPDSIRNSLRSLFGENALDITQSDLYNAGRQMFEMWQPRLRAEVYADAEIKKTDGGYEITARFFTDNTRSQIRDTVTGAFQRSDNGDGYILKSMATQA